VSPTHNLEALLVFPQRSVTKALTHRPPRSKQAGGAFRTHPPSQPIIIRRRRLHALLHRAASGQPLRPLLSPPSRPPVVRKPAVHNTGRFCATTTTTLSLSSLLYNNPLRRRSPRLQRRAGTPRQTAACQARLSRRHIIVGAPVSPLVLLSSSSPPPDSQPTSRRRPLFPFPGQQQQPPIASVDTLALRRHGRNDIDDIQGHRDAGTILSSLDPPPPPPPPPHMPSPP
jgi:hypothetical protein